MWLAGLRGAMAYALALKSTFDFEKGPIMLIVTLIYAFISILGVGSFMSPILEKLQVSRRVSIGPSSASTIVKSINDVPIAKAPEELEYD